MRPVLMIFLAIAVLAGAMQMLRGKPVPADADVTTSKAAGSGGARSDEIAAERARQEAELKARLEAAKGRSEFEKSVTAMQALRVRWDDAVKLAESTARIALSGPVGGLQSIRQEAQAMVVPSCLDDAKSALVDGMSTTINGYMAFMQNKATATLEVVIAADEAQKSFERFDMLVGACDRLSPKSQ